MNILMRIDLGAYRRGQDKRLQKMVLETYFEAMTRANEVFHKLHPTVPLLYDSGVRYRNDPKVCNKRGVCIGELWLDYPSILRLGWEDCDGLSAALAGELRARAPNSVGPKRRPAAAVRLKSTRTAGLWHAIVVDLETGEVFDPSKKLGMGQDRRKRRHA